MGKRILVINPGSTSTKIAVYEDENRLWAESIEHSLEELEKYGSIPDQADMRFELVVKTVSEKGFSLSELDAVVGRGGTVAPIEAGGYLVNEALKNRILYGDILSHASNLGALIADAIAAPLGVPAYIYDAVASDEFYEIAHITGLPEIIRQPYSHVLNTKAMGRKYAISIGKRYEDINIIACHIGGGVSVSIHEKGRIVDSIEDDGGPFSVERAGVIPLSYIVGMAYSGDYTKSELMKKLRGKGGVIAHLGTHDLREVERRIAEGDEKARTVYEAFAYQISKGIGEMAPVLSGNIDAIILTGGAARSEMLTEQIKARVEFIAPVVVMPGENEMEALALGGLRILNGEEEAKIYADKTQTALPGLIITG